MSAIAESYDPDLAKKRAECWLNEVVNGGDTRGLTEAKCMQSACVLTQPAQFCGLDMFGAAPMCCNQPAGPARVCTSKMEEVMGINVPAAMAETRPFAATMASMNCGMHIPASCCAAPPRQGCCGRKRQGASAEDITMVLGFIVIIALIIWAGYLVYSR
jgi:hypothetical protein